MKPARTPGAKKCGLMPSGLCLVAITAVLLAASLASAQASRIPFGQDNHAFRYLLDKLELKPLSQFTDIGQVASASDTVLIVLGQPAPVKLAPGGIKHFLEAGGALLLATDRATDVLDEDFDVSVNGRLLTIDRDHPKAYKGLTQCPIVGGASAKEPPIFQGLGRIASNNPSYLEIRSSNLSVLARFPRECRIDATRNATLLPRFNAARAFAVGGVVGKGRLLVLSDHSVFINDMMMQPDNDNFDFAFASLQWLRERDSKSEPGRRHALFMDEGVAITNFLVPVREGPDIPLPGADAWNQLMIGMEQDNFFNKLLFAYFSHAKVLSAIALAASIALVGYGFLYLARRNYAIDPHAPLAVANMGPALGTAALVDERHLTMLREGKLWEAARDLARDSFWTLGHATSFVPKAARPEPPRILIEGTRRQRRRLREVALRLWAIAYDNRPRRLSPREFRQLVGQIDELKQASREGNLRLGGVKENHDG